MLYLFTHSPRLFVNLIVLYVIKQMLKVFYVFPINEKKIIFVSYGGKQISCNPYYIYKRIKVKDPHKYIVYWVSSSLKRDRIFKEDYLLYNKGIKYLFHLLTAKVIIENDGLKPYIPIRRKQLLINTWHGGGLFKKNFGRATTSEMVYISYLRKITKNNIKLYLSSCRAWTDIVARVTFAYCGEVLKSGFPRNDLFFGTTDKIAIDVKKYFSIPIENKIILYAPTFRGGTRGIRKGVSDLEIIDVKAIIENLEIKTGNKYCFLFRGHHASDEKFIEGVLDASSYPDMQELLAAADIFISDYSSCLWDYSLSYRPCFIYAPDFDTYSKSPGFESDYREWPFPIAKSNESLLREMDIFNSSNYVDKVKKYHNQYGSYEKGTAADSVLDYIANWNM